MNILASWKESLKVLKPEPSLAILRSACYAMANIPGLWTMILFQICTSPWILTLCSLLCGADFASKAVVFPSDFQQRMPLFLAPVANSIQAHSVFGWAVLITFVIVQNIVRFFVKKQVHRDQYRQLLDWDDNREAPRVREVLARYGQTTVLLIIWLTIITSMVYGATFIRLPARFVSYASHVMLMPHAFLTEISVSLSYQQQFGRICCQALYFQLFNGIGAGLPLIAMFFFFINAGNHIRAAIRNSITIVVRYYPAFFAVRLIIDALIIAIATAGRIMLSCASAQVHLMYWCAVIWIIAYWGSQFLWQIMYVLYQMWAPQIQQGPQQPHDRNNTRIVLDSASN